MAVIKNYLQLESEIKRLTDIRKAQELTLISNLNSVRQSLQPANILKSAFTTLSGDNISGKEAVSKALKAGLGYAFIKVLFRASNPLMQVIGATIAPAIATRLINKNTATYLLTLVKRIKSWKNK
jgi:hypothetical protein